MAGPGVSRRCALGGVAGVALPVLAACGTGEADTATDSGAPVDRSTTDGPSTSLATPTEESSAGAGGALLPVDEVPVGGGVVLSERRIVVTQPEAGRFEGFSAECTHRGCTVAGVGETIQCPCHGSRFSIADGSPVQGPATSPLPRIRVVADGRTVRLV